MTLSTLSPRKRTILYFCVWRSGCFSLGWLSHAPVSVKTTRGLCKGATVGQLQAVSPRGGSAGLGRRPGRAGRGGAGPRRARPAGGPAARSHSATPEHHTSGGDGDKDCTEVDGNEINLMHLRTLLHTPPELLQEEY